MSFFQNPFMSEFRGNWVLADRHHIPTFNVPGNAGRGEEVVTVWERPPYDLSGNDSDGDSANTLVIRYALRGEHNWATLSINVASGAVSAAAVTPQEIVTALKANTTFSSFFEAFSSPDTFGGSGAALYRLSIRQKRPITEFRFYIVNGRAEEVLKFNARAGVAEIPSYFDRHTVNNAIAQSFSDGQGVIIGLDPDANDVDAAVIDSATTPKGVSLGFDSSVVREDWQLLAGRSGMFQFTKGPGDSTADSSTETIIYPAGAKVGDLAMKIVVLYDGTAGTGTQVAKFEMPHVLTSEDLISPHVLTSEDMT